MPWAVWILGAVLALAGLAGCAPPLETGAQPQERLLVKFARVQGRGMDRAVRARAFRAARVSPAAQFAIVPQWSVVTVDPGQTREAAMAALAAQPGVVEVEPDLPLRIDRTPNDSRFSFLYGLNNNGQTGGVADADIDAPEAWDLATGGDVLVAVIDTGVDYTHPDLAANIWSNPGEIPGNGVDDDGNGFVDDVHGYDFANGDPDPRDDNNHGTHVAGIIAAAGDNGQGVVGVNWRARIMALKFMDANGRGSTSAAIQALDYAVRMGARVSNNSWGGGGFSRALQDAIAAAGRAGHLFVAAAGNDGVNADRSPHYPSGYTLDNIVSVAATDDADRLAGFSNYGAASVDLGAPGVAIESTLRNNRYGSLSGTSMATPYVTGAAALLLAANPGLTVAQLKAALLDNVDPIAALRGRSVTGGRLNLFRALSAVAQAAPPANPAPPATPAPAPLAVNPTSLTLVAGSSRTLSVSGGQAPYTWSSADPTIARVDATGTVRALAAGTTTVTVGDAAGSRVLVSVVVTPAQVANLTVSTPRSVIRVGDTLALSVSGGRPPYVWRSSDPQVATVDAQGVVTGVAVGGVVVTATDADGNSGHSSVISVIAPVLQLQVGATRLAVGETLTLRAGGGTPPYRWSVSDPQVATVSADGVLTALAPGQVTVTVGDAAGARATSPVITVAAAAGNPAPTPGAGALGLDQSAQIVATAQTVRLTVSGGSAPFQWTLDNPAAGALFVMRHDPRVAWFIAGTQAGVTTTVTVTDAGGARAVSAPIEVVPSRF